MMKCSKCDLDNPSDAKFCNNCGFKFDNHGKTCPEPECGRKGLPEVAVFCPDCGAKLSGGFNSFTETVNGVTFDMVAVKGGTFKMGSNDGEKNEKPMHQVTVSDFFMGKKTGNTSTLAVHYGQ